MRKEKKNEKYLFGKYYDHNIIIICYSYEIQTKRAISAYFVH